MKPTELIKGHSGLVMLIGGVKGAILSMWAMFYAFHITPWSHEWAYFPEAVTGIALIAFFAYISFKGWDKMEN